MKPRNKEMGPDKGGLVDAIRTVDDGVNPPVVSTFASNQWTDLTYMSTKGWDIENFNARMARGELIPHTPFQQVETVSRRTPIKDFKIVYDNGTTDTITNWMQKPVELGMPKHDDPLDYTLPDNSELVQQAAAAIYSQGWDSLTFISELRQLKTLYRTVVKRIEDMFRKVPPGTSVYIICPPWMTWKQARKWYTDKYANLWLEWRYAWRTLLYDLEDLNKVISELGFEDRTRFSKRRGRSLTDSDFQVGTQGNVNTMFTWEKEISYEISLRGSVTADITPPKFQFNPVVTGWELTPWSFVLDWLLDIGQALEALSFNLSAQKYSASEGYHVIRREKGTIEAVINPYDNDGITSVEGEWQYDITQTYTTRIPTRVSSLPQFKFNLDLPKGVDLWALLRRYLK